MNERKARRVLKQHEKARRDVANDLLMLSEKIDVLPLDKEATAEERREFLTLALWCPFGDDFDHLYMWGDLLDLDAHKMGLAYAKLRKHIVPCILSLWENKEQMQPSPEHLLRDYATTFLYPNIVDAVALSLQIDTQQARMWKHRETLNSSKQQARGHFVEGQRHRLMATWKAIGAAASLVVLPLLGFGVPLAVCVALVGCGWAGIDWKISQVGLNASQDINQACDTFERQLVQWEQSLTEDQCKLYEMADKRLWQLLGLDSDAEPDPSQQVPQSLPISGGTDPQVDGLTKASTSPPSSTPNVSCPHCKGQIAGSPELAGREVGCPHCDGRLIMPGAAVARPAVVVQPSSESPTANARHFLASAKPTKKTGPPSLPKARKMAAIQPTKPTPASGEQVASGPLDFLESAAAPNIKSATASQDPTADLGPNQGNRIKL